MPNDSLDDLKKELLTLKLQELKKDKQPDKLESLKDALPLFSVALILIGFYRLYLYYSFFDIEIYNFLDTTEFVFAFAKLFMNLIVAVLFVSIVVYITETMIEPALAGGGLDRRISMFNTRLGQLARENDYKIFRRITRIFAYLMFAVALWGIIVFLVIDQYIPEAAVHVLFLFVWIGLLYFFISPSEVEKGTLIPKLLLNPLVIILFLIASTTMGALISFQNVRKGHPEKAVDLHVSGKVIRSAIGPSGVAQSDPLLYIGSSRNYYFFWLPDDGRSLVIPSADVDSVFFQSEDIL